MPSVLVRAPDEPVTLSAQAAKRLLDRGDGDAALLYIALLRRHGDVPPRSLAGELRWDRARIEAAESVLRDLGLIAPEAPPAEPADEPPSYRQEELAGKLEESADFRRLDAAPVPAELPRERPGGRVPMAAEQGQVQQGGVPVPPLQKALHRLGGEGDGFVGGMNQDAGHGSASFLL